MTRKRIFFAVTTAVAVLAVIFLGRGLVQSAIGGSSEQEPAGVLQLRGTVRSLDGQPIRGARVEVYVVDESHAFTPLGVHQVERDTSFTAPFSPQALHGEGERLLLVRASAPGHASESRTLTADVLAERADLRLELRLAADPASVEVTVEASPELPSANASVLLTFDPIAAPRDALYAWQARTDERGVARFEGLPQLPGTLHVWAEDERGRVFRKVAKEAGAITTEVRVAIERGRTARVQLVATSPGDLTAADVVLREAEGPWRARARPDATGALELVGVPMGVPLLAEVSGAWVLADGAPAKTWLIERDDARADPREAADPADLAAVTAPAPELTLRVSPGGILRGVAVDERGQPVAGAMVTATPDRDGAGVPRRVTTDGQGRFSLSGLSLATAWTMEARHPAYALARAPAIDARASDLRLELRSGGALFGRVVDGEGRGVAAVEVYAHAMKRQAAGDNRTAAEALPEYTSVRTDEEGRYRLGRVNPGLYRFEVRPPARMQWANVAAVVKEHEVKAGDNALPDITVARGASLRGLAEAEARAEVQAAAASGALEVAILPDGQQGVPHRVAVQPDAQGRFIVDDLEPGSFRVQVRSKRHGWSEPVRVTLREGDTADAAFRFAATSRLEGKVTLAGGGALKNARIDLYRERGADRPAHDLSGNWAKIADDGSYAVTGLSPGDYTVRISSDDAAPLLAAVKIAGERTTRAFSVERGDHVRIALRSSRPDANTGELAGKVVMLEPRDPGGVPMQAISDAEGIAVFEKVPSGAYRARAVMPGMPGVSLRSQDHSAQLTID